jgi:hypothetical protein
VERERDETPARRRTGVRLTDRDLIALEFVAEHRIVQRPHLQALLGVGPGAAAARLRALAGADFLACDRSPDGRDDCYRIMARGLAALGSTLPPTRLDYGGFEHDVGAAWIWLAARDGLWGRPRDVVSERRMRSHDRSEDGRAAPFAVRLGGVGPRGADRLHYPDVLLIGADGRRVAFELELSAKSRSRRERILSGYAADPRIGAVVYLVESAAIGRAIQATARKLGISDLIHVQRVERRRPGRGAAGGVDRAASRGDGERSGPGGAARRAAGGRGGAERGARGSRDAGGEAAAR